MGKVSDVIKLNLKTLDREINDGTVQNLINGIRAYAKGEIGSDNQVEISYYSWQVLMVKRGTDQFYANYHVAAAEHYNYIRYLAGLTGDPTTQLAPRGYDLKKKAYFAVGQEDRLRANPKYPVLPPHPKVLAWGNKGAADGLKDYQAANPGKKLEYGGAIPPLLQFNGVPQDTANKVGNYTKNSAKKIGVGR